MHRSPAPAAHGQLLRYDRLRTRFAAQLDAAAAPGEPCWVRADWRRRNADLRAHLLPLPPLDVLRHPAIRYQMFVDERHLAAELPYVLERLPTLELAWEDPAGNPPRVGLVPQRVITSANTVHHLHHLLRYEEATRRPLKQARTVVEWGGGYGNLAKLLMRLHGGTVTYVLIDTPVFAALQWLYLSSVLGEDHVRLHTRPGEQIVAGTCTIVPVGLVAALDVDADLFISTWALNESTPAAQRHVIEREWFGADSMLMAMHHGDPLEPHVLEAGASPMPVATSMPGQRYFFRRSRPGRADAGGVRSTSPAG